ncbi:ABC transporter permease [Pseudooceanicola sp. HF7]|uniref:ABC transporter permease n=1 Tax=Pseudooceanicola sp. HF7 TaxID=2721560 RepID=UPI0014307B1A|nr:ABC transporter permease [Pseudooceanicola sp. HF7]NIZ10620.1 ABC transporter permease [Pseudooceanicola sp. HF7]
MSTQSTSGGFGALVRRIFRSRYAGALISLVLVSVFLSLYQPVFLTWPNIMNIVKSNSVGFILAIGATFVVISGTVDLSFGSATTASAMAFGLLLVAGTPLPLAVLGAIFAGFVLGAINGYLVAYAKISFFVVTLGTLSIFQSVALVVNSGTSVSVFSVPGFSALNQFVNGNIGPVPVLLVFNIVLFLIAGGVLRFTAFGRSLYAIGSNIEAARLNGINVKRVLLIVFIISGLSAGLASVVQVGRLTVASPNVDMNLLLTVLAAVLIGGTAMTGGEGGVLGTMIGMLFLGVVQNGLTLSSVSSFWQGTLSGSILILSVWLGGIRGVLRAQKQKKTE